MEQFLREDDVNSNTFIEVFFGVKNMIRIVTLQCFFHKARKFILRISKETVSNGDMLRTVVMKIQSLS